MASSSSTWYQQRRRTMARNNASRSTAIRTNVSAENRVIRCAIYTRKSTEEGLQQYGVKLMSMGFMNPGDKPQVWRGPMLHSVIQQFLRSVDWGDLGYLLIDLPPGTGDVQLSWIKPAPLTGAVVVAQT